jgi:hypothetical protein
MKENEQRTSMQLSLDNIIGDEDDDAKAEFITRGSLAIGATVVAGLAIGLGAVGYHYAPKLLEYFSRYI